MGELAGSVFPSGIQEAIEEFSRSIMETPQFSAWEQNLRDVSNDRKALDLAQQIRRIRADMRQKGTGRPSASERQQKLAGLYASYEDLPTVAEFRLAEAELRTLCVQANADLSDGLGVDFASHCARGCCG